LLARVQVLCEERGGREHHPGRAEAALQAMLLVKALLHRMEPAGWREPFDGRDLVPVNLDGEHRAGLDRDAVKQHRAGAAARRVAADVRSGEPERLAEEVDEEKPRLDRGRARLTVHIRVDGLRVDSLFGDGLGHDASLPSAALRRPRSVNTRTTL